MYDAVPYARSWSGLVMMSVLQNALPTAPLRSSSQDDGQYHFRAAAAACLLGVLRAYVLAAVVRGCGGRGGTVGDPAFRPDRISPSAVDRRVRFLRKRRTGSLGMIAGIWSEKIDQVAASRTSSSCSHLPLGGVLLDPFAPGFLARALAFQPFFYMIEGFATASSGSRSPPVSESCRGDGFPGRGFRNELAMLKSGYKLRH